MINKLYSVVILLSLAVPVAVVAAENAEVHGLVEFGGRGVDNNTDSALFQEFRDLDDSLLGNVQVEALKGAYHFQFDAERPGTDDQSYQFNGGEYDNFKYKFNYDEMPHNYLFDAISPATGIGTDHLVFPAAADAHDISTWTKFDYAVDHKTYGGEFEVSLHSPFYINAGVERQEQDGLRPYSARVAQYLAEVPEPISNKTDNLHLKGGYLSKTLSASITGSLSSFRNDNDIFTFDYNGSPPAINTIVVLPPDNTYDKLAADLNWRHLPVDSVLAVGGSYAHLENNFSASDLSLNSITWSGNNINFDSLNRTHFNGDIDYTNASIALTSKPMSKLNTKLYYRYLDRDDNSSLISYTDLNGFHSSHREDFQKDDAGFDVGYRLPHKTRLEAGYQYMNVDRSIKVDGEQITEGEGLPALGTRDDSVYMQVKNSTLAWLTAKVRYKHLERDSEKLAPGLTSNPLADTPVPTPFYYLDQANDEWKLGLDFHPVHRLVVGLDFTYKDTNYDHAIDTRQNDTRRNVYLNTTWRATSIAKITGFVGFEKVDTDANRIDENEARYSQSINDDFWNYGLAANIDATDKLTFNLSWQYQESDGEVNFSDNLTGTALEDINNSDDYTKKQLEAKAIYAIDPKLKMTLGYLYERFEYQDINTDNYSYQPDSTQIYYLSGLNADPDYEVNVGYLMVAYGF